MQRINWRRVLAGGFVAGVVLNIGEFAVEPLMGPQMERFLGRLGLPLPSESAMLAFVATAFLTGIASVWLYAAIQPRHPAGMQTASIAGTAVWALSCLLPNIVLYAFGLFTAQLFWFSSVWPLVETVVATMAGGWVYRERPIGAVSSARA